MHLYLTLIFIAAFLEYNLHSIKCTLLEYMIHCFLYIQNCATTTTINFSTFSSSYKETQTHQQPVLTLPSQPPTPCNHSSTLKTCLSQTLHKNHMRCVLCSLVFYSAWSRTSIFILLSYFSIAWTYLILLYLLPAVRHELTDTSFHFWLQWINNTITICARVYV